MQDSVEETNEKQVADGARYLDLNAPGWFRSIDLNLLNMSNPCCCVVGQLFRSFVAGLEQLDVDATLGEDEALGFKPPAWSRLLERR